MFVSVIIPTYNRAHFIVESVESVISQDWLEKEIIIVDDGSIDDTAQLLSKYYNSIKYMKVAHGGVSKARNAGIAVSSGDVLAFLDSDDLWLPGKLRKQVEYFKNNPDISICQTEEIWIRNGRRVNSKDVHKKYSGWIFEHCVPRCIVSPSAVILKRTVLDDIGLFDEEMPLCEDYDMWLQAALKYQIVTIPDALVIKRGGHADQLSKKHLQDVWRIHALKKVLKTEEGKSYRNLITRDIARRAEIVAKGAYKRGNKKLGDQYGELAKKYSHNY